jgi:voltage-gated sodium channel
MHKAIEICNLVFYFVFLAEMIIKIIGMGFMSYFRDRFNIFDFIIVLLSTVDVVLWF